MRALSTAVVLCAVAALGGCGKAEFKKFTSPAGKFTADFPGTPKETSQAVPNANTTMNMFSVEERSGAYMAAYADMPISRNESAAETEMRLDGARDGMVNNVGGKALSSSKVTLGGKHPGREVIAEVPSKSAHIRARVYLAGTRMYQIMVIGKKSFVDSADATRFLDSLALTN